MECTFEQKGSLENKEEQKIFRNSKMKVLRSHILSMVSQ